jgi:hypothetical protein
MQNRMFLSKITPGMKAFGLNEAKNCMLSVENSVLLLSHPIPRQIPPLKRNKKKMKIYGYQKK